MIIITNTYRRKKFKELINYIMNDKGRIDESNTFTITHNLRSTDSNEIIKEFQKNDEYRKKRKNGVVLYSEILSFSPKDSRGNLNLDVLEDITRKFIELRGEKALCLAKPHIENENIHIHFCFSGTEYKSSKTLRIDNKQFREIRIEMEKYQLEKYPELTNSICYLNNWEKNRLIDQEKLKQSDKEFQLKKRTGKQSDKDIVRAILQECYQKSESKGNFFNRIAEQGIELYKYIEKTNGIKFNSRKFRFKSLKISEKQIELLQKNYDRLAELKDIRQQKEQNKEGNRKIER